MSKEWRSWKDKPAVDREIRQTKAVKKRCYCRVKIENDKDDAKLKKSFDNWMEGLE